MQPPAHAAHLQYIYIWISNHLKIWIHSYQYWSLVRLSFVSLWFTDLIFIPISQHSVGTNFYDGSAAFHRVWWVLIITVCMLFHPSSRVQEWILRLTEAVLVAQNHFFVNSSETNSLQPQKSQVRDLHFKVCTLTRSILIFPTISSLTCDLRESFYTIRFRLLSSLRTTVNSTTAGAEAHAGDGVITLSALR